MTKEEKNEYKKKWRLANKEHIKKYKKEYYENNRDTLLKKQKEYRKDNKEKISQWRKSNKEYIKKYSKDWMKGKYYSDPLHKFKHNLRCRTYKAFKKESWKKGGGTEKLLGCDWETAMKHMESQFESWMNWDNHGEWHIDHIIPLASATTKEEMIKLCHYTNLQPLLSEENLSKGAKILI